MEFDGIEHAYHVSMYSDKHSRPARYPLPTCIGIIIRVNVSFKSWKSCVTQKLVRGCAVCENNILRRGKPPSLTQYHTDSVFHCFVHKKL